jgi:hypothetical protein
MQTTFTEPGTMTGLGSHTGAALELPGDFRGIARVLQGLFLHESWAGHYGVKFTDTGTVHLRQASAMLDAVLAKNGAPLGTAREPRDRVPTNCRGFTTAAVALLRAHGVPARARCGFGMYFNEGWGEDHWVVEYHEDGRWKRGDAQLDEAQVAALGITWDVADLPEGQFRTGAEAWRRVRAGSDQEIKYGLSPLGEHGEYWIAGNLMRDAAALDGVETLPWDCWDPMPAADEPIDYAYFDRLAAGDERVSVPGEVYNLLHRRAEPLR